MSLRTRNVVDMSRPALDTADVAGRFWARVRKGPGCWEWQGYKSRGYGFFSVAGARAPAHRLVMEQQKGRRLCRSELVDHLCRNPACVRADHLEVVTPMVNSQRGLRAHKGPLLARALDVAERLRRGEDPATVRCLLETQARHLQALAQGVSHG